MTARAKKQGSQQASAQAPPASFSAFFRGRVFLLILALGLAGVTWAIFEFVVWNKLPRELVGKWEVVGGTQDGGKQAGAVYEFYRSGSMVGRIKHGKDPSGEDLTAIIEASVRVEGGKIYATSKKRSSGESATIMQTIVTLTDDELVVRNDKGEDMKMKRVR